MAHGVVFSCTRWILRRCYTNNFSCNLQRNDDASIATQFLVDNFFCDFPRNGVTTAPYRLGLWMI